MHSHLLKNRIRPSPDSRRPAGRSQPYWAAAVVVAAAAAFGAPAALPASPSAQVLAALAAPPAEPGLIPGPPIRSAVRVPAEIGGWKLAGEARHFDEHGIFDYMDGAGEIYVSYRFAGLDVFEYAAEGAQPIVAEVYRMRSPDDAFGLLSLDWTGAPQHAFAHADSLPRAVYSDGALRVWAGDLFARIMPYDTTAASEAAALELGRTLLGSRAPASPPALAQSALAADEIHLKPGSLRFVRMHTMLNAAFYLHPDNVLELDRTNDVLVGEFEEGGAVVLVVYASAETAARALARFRSDVLGEPLNEAPLGGTTAGSGPFGEIRCGYRLEGRALALVFASGEESGVLARLEKAFKTVARVTE